MSDTYKFKYLDGDFIKRLHQNVSKNVQQGIKDSSKVIKSGVGKDKNVDKKLNEKAVQQTTTANHDSSRHETVKSNNRLDLESPRKACENKSLAVEPQLNPAPISNVKMNSANKVSNSTFMRTNIPATTEFGDSETCLAKITSSQRAICASLDTIIPNLMYKPSFETPLEAKRCRDRFDSFLKRFTRNYSYPIELMITEIQSNKQFPPSLFASKVYLLYNILQTALSCYSTNLRNFLDRCIPPKITDLINSIVEVTMICVEGKLFDQDDFVIQAVLDKVNEIQMKLEGIHIMKDKSDSVGKQWHVSTIKLPQKQPNQLCMYGIPKISAKPAKKSQRPTQSKFTTRRNEQTTKAVSPSANIFGNLNRANRQSQPPQPTATSFRYNRICSNAPKKLARSSSSAHSSPSFGCKDKIFDANAEINNNNNQEFDVAATVSHRDDPFNNRNIVESTNRSTSGSVVEKELYKCKNTKYSQIISTKDVDLRASVCQLPDTDVLQIEKNDRKSESDHRSRQISSNRNRMNAFGSKETKKKIEILKPQSVKFISRISEELQLVPVERIHKNVDFGEQIFIEKFLALETSI